MVSRKAARGFPDFRVLCTPGLMSGKWCCARTRFAAGRKLLFMLLMKDPLRCPGCGHRYTIRWDIRRCANCKAKIHKPTDNFAELKREWILAFWVYFPLNSSGYYRGWVHSDHLKDDPQPLAENLTFKAPPEHYGMLPPTIPYTSAQHTPKDLGAEKLKAKE